MRPFGSRILAAFLAILTARAASGQPNVILCMTDDQGWGDAGYMGHPHLRTPHLDAMARDGLRFDRFYAASAVCSPTRASCLTGRHPERIGIVHANRGHMPDEEVTIAELLRTAGYRTGHFGKWHLGTLTRDVVDSNRGGREQHDEHYAPPWEHGFDVCFSTEAKVPTWDPMVHPESGEPYGTAYWDQTGSLVTTGLDGDDSRIIMDRALRFVSESDGRPFLAVIWFHTPHLPVASGSPFVEMYEGHPGKIRDYYACLTAMDEQIGRLRRLLRDMDIEQDTMLWFASDNGPESRVAAGVAAGSSGPLRARKRSLHEGGIRVPGLLVWPRLVSSPRVVTMPCSTSDYLPTIARAVGVEAPPALDGVDLMPLIEGGSIPSRRIGFVYGSLRALVGSRFKLVGREDAFELFDLVEDPGESEDLSGMYPELANEMEKEMLEFAGRIRQVQ